MWAAMTRSIEMIVALFEYYSASVATAEASLHASPANSHANRYFIAGRKFRGDAGICWNIFLIIDLPFDSKNEPLLD